MIHNEQLTRGNGRRQVAGAQRKPGESSEFVGASGSDGWRILRYEPQLTEAGSRKTHIKDVGGHFDWRETLSFVGFNGAIWEL